MIWDRQYFLERNIRMLKEDISVFGADNEDTIRLNNYIEELKWLKKNTN